jgi:hypothetical protein
MSQKWDSRFLTLTVKKEESRKQYQQKKPFHGNCGLFGGGE